MAEKRFEKLEIGILPSAPYAPPPPPPPAPPAAPAAPESSSGGLGMGCPRCGALARAGEKTCWACLKPLEAALAASAAPLDARSAGAVPAAAEDLVLRLDGRIFRSSDPALPPEVKEIMERVRASGLTPELLGELRREIPEVRYRPARSYYPSDGDMDFWRRSGYGGGYGGFYGQFSSSVPPFLWPLIVGAVLGVLAFVLWAFKSLVFDAAKTLAAPP